MTAGKKRASDLKRRASSVVTALKKKFPKSRTALEFRDPYQLLVATILSAQCTDERVNKVTPALFAHYPDARSMSLAVQEELEQEIRSTGFFRNKSKSIIACSRDIVERHGGNVPAHFDDLVKLPGVGRKTANCVMGGAFGINSGIVVDTHVQRIAGRLGLSKESDPVKIEADLMVLVPQKDWYEFSNLLIVHGRTACDARKPECATCVVLRQCPSGPKFLNGHRPPTKEESIRSKQIARNKSKKN